MLFDIPILEENKSPGPGWQDRLLSPVINTTGQSQICPRLNPDSLLNQRKSL